MKYSCLLHQNGLVVFQHFRSVQYFLLIAVCWQRKLYSLLTTGKNMRIQISLH